MTQPLYARWAGRFLGAQVDETRTLDEGEREHAIGAIERAIRERGRRKARMRWALRLGAAAAAILCVGAGGHLLRTRAPAHSIAAAALTAAPGGEGAAGQGPQAPQGSQATGPLTVVGRPSGAGVTIASGSGAPASLEDGVPIAAGHRIVARGRSRATLAFSTGTSLTVENGGDVTVVEEGRAQIFSLGAGEIRARVAKLGAGERFVVRTPDAEVEVRGTSFSVAVAPSDPSCGGGSVTRVTVDEGVVVVRQGATESRVSKGEEWPLGCDLPSDGVDAVPAGAAPDAADPTDSPSPAFRHRHPPHAVRESASASTVSASSLVEQNNLFSEAIALRNGGQHAAAIAAFEKFLARYPSSNLSENAAVERMKLLLVDDPPRGVVAARQYLRRYPSGFAQTDAKAAVAGSR